MAAEELLLNLFDWNWFGHAEKNPSQSGHVPQETARESGHGGPDYDHGHSSPVPPSIKVRSMSEQILDPELGSFFNSSDPLSRGSFLPNPKLQTVFSGKEVRDFPENGRENVGEDDQEVTKVEPANKKKESEKRRRRRGSRLGGATSKSLSDLEFEELKGFIDLGFVFTEEQCTDSKLVSMIPGLQRLCRNCTSTDHDHHDHDADHGGVVSRPYLSEAWDVLESERKKKEDHRTVKIPLMIDWKTQPLASEIQVKDQLKFWAHSVASTVR